MRVPLVLRVLLLALFAAACASAPPARSQWVLLGEREVDFRVDHDGIHVGDVEGRFREFRFVVHGGAIEMFDLKVTLGDGEFFRSDTRMVFDRVEGRILHLPGWRVVRRVDFVYRSLRGGDRATVTLFGR
jgi:hypothetical protein